MPCYSKLKTKPKQTNPQRDKEMHRSAKRPQDAPICRDHKSEETTTCTDFKETQTCTNPCAKRPLDARIAK